MNDPLTSEERAAFSSLDRKLAYSGEFKPAFSPAEIKSLRDACARLAQENARLRAALTDFLEWGPMTSSDRHLFTERFTELLTHPNPAALAEE